MTINGKGIEVEGNDNLIIKNNASRNTTNYFITSNNRFGPIIDLTVLFTAAVNGDSAASNIPTTDPSANFATH